MAEQAAAGQVRLVPWTAADLELERRFNVPEMKLHLGGPEPDERIVGRHRRMLEMAERGTGLMFRVEAPPTGEVAGSVGYWEREWGGETVYEMGWSVLPEFQGRGIAGAAVVTVLAGLRENGRHRYVFAYPSVTNGASNALCRKAGFTLLGECDFEFPKDHQLRCNEWRLDLEPTT
ncbi:GNAT family N-acetyltransferase [Micromonospora zhanjiangensis]|uniref:GNAT family N-acetyltransferase n=1 Tax=Micromonospora zhanjiangensis TaxID=1522057 RepID=A0ABV8KE55_9ACTN